MIISAKKFIYAKIIFSAKKYFLCKKHFFGQIFSVKDFLKSWWSGITGTFDWIYGYGIYGYGIYGYGFCFWDNIFANKKNIFAKNKIFLAEKIIFAKNKIFLAEKIIFEKK